jgi:hypothetical protein
MGEWSDYFEDFPEENPGNYDEFGNYDPNGTIRKERKRQEIAHKKLDKIYLIIHSTGLAEARR